MKKNKFTLEKSGFEINKNIIQKKYIKKINSEIKNIMSFHVKNKKKSNSELFKLITDKSKKLRGNIFKTFSKLASCLEIIYTPELKKFFKKKKYRNLTLISSGIVVMEPKKNTFLFPIHQDLKNRLSCKSILMWIPLNNSNGSLGGITLYKNSNKIGPLKHEVGPAGIMQLKKDSLKKISKLKKFNYTKYKIGDILFCSPFVAHQSIVNSHNKESRWTLIIQVDDMSKSKHLKKSLNPFNVDFYSSSLTNEETRKKLLINTKIN